MKFFPAIFSIIIAAAGWYYLFYSPAASRLAGIESNANNSRRQWLRRANGIVLFALAISFFAGFYTVDVDSNPHAFVLVWLTVFALLFTAVVLALLDVRLTAKLRRQFRDQKK